MREIQRWVGSTALVTGVLLGTACGDLPETGGKQPDESRGNAFAQRGAQPEALYNVPEQQGNEPPRDAHQGDLAAKLPKHVLTVDRGYNATIGKIGSSIDPRTPRLDGQANNSKQDDAGGMMAHRYAVLGGANYSPAAWGAGGWSTSTANEGVHGYDAPYSYVNPPIYLRGR
uniref:Lipoprotein n=1 Tax=Cystobacterineae bacterium TaxID=1934914 RepID=A0A3Q8I8T0_9BACT|nr:lipoprotein [Myxococcaceae bacterium MCy9487]